MMSHSGLAWLQSWYMHQCDGEWEHGQGVRISTLDNPGWRLKVRIEGTPLEGRRLDLPLVQRPDERDWIHVRCDGKQFEAAGGPSNLEEILDAFQRFTTAKTP